MCVLGPSGSGSRDPSDTFALARRTDSRLDITMTTSFVTVIEGSFRNRRYSLGEGARGCQGTISRFRPESKMSREMYARGPVATVDLDRDGQHQLR